MDYYAGIDVSLEASSVCVVDGAGKIVREAKVASEPAALIGWFASFGLDVTRIGLEAGPLSQWLYGAMKESGLAVELLETRHVQTALKRVFLNLGGSSNLRDRDGSLGLDRRSHRWADAP